MPSGMHQVDLELPIETVWNFVQDLDRWVPLVPGYIQHEKINERHLNWEFYLDLGMIKKKISLMVTITEWIEPTKITFDLKDVNEHFTGNGFFEAKKMGDRLTKITGFLAIEAEGMMGKMVNRILKTSMPSMAEELTDAIADKMK